MIWLIYLTMSCPNGLQTWTFEETDREVAMTEADGWASSKHPGKCICMSVTVEATKRGEE